MSVDSTKTTIHQVVVENDHVSVTWGDGHHSRFHSAWLCHSLPYSESDQFSAPSGRFLRNANAPASLESAVVTQEGDLEVTWQPNSFKSMFRAAWLRDHCYSTEERARRRRAVELWDAGIANGIPQSDYTAVCADDTALLTLYDQVIDYGFALLRNVPARHGEVLHAAAFFGLVSPTPYADDPSQPELENIQVNPRIPVNTRMCDFLEPHTDTCWRASLSGLIYLHCLKSHGSGGETLLVDGFAVAERLRAAEPEAFATLCDVPLNFAAKVSNGDDWRARGRVISLGPDQEVCGLRYGGRSIHQLDLPAALIEPVLDALEKFEAILRDEGLWLKIKLLPGDLVVTDNQRVLHGRTAFDPTEGDRHLQTCSTRRDEFHNRYRRLARKCGREDWAHELSWGVI